MATVAIAGVAEPCDTILLRTQRLAVVELVDAKSQNLVWRGTASDTASDKPEKNAKKIQKAAEQTLKQYPPK